METYAQCAGVATLNVKKQTTLSSISEQAGSINKRLSVCASDLSVAADRLTFDRLIGAEKGDPCEPEREATLLEAIAETQSDTHSLISRLEGVIARINSAIG